MDLTVIAVVLDKTWLGVNLGFFVFFAAVIAAVVIIWR